MSANIHSPLVKNRSALNNFKQLLDDTFIQIDLQLHWNIILTHSTHLKFNGFAQGPNGDLKPSTFNH